MSSMPFCVNFTRVIYVGMLHTPFVLFDLRPPCTLLSLLLAKALWIAPLEIPKDASLSPSIVRAVFGYEVRDAGVLLVLSAAFWGSGMILWGICRCPEEARGSGLGRCGLSRDFSRIFADGLDKRAVHRTESRSSSRHGDVVPP